LTSTLSGQTPSSNERAKLMPLAIQAINRVANFVNEGSDFAEFNASTSGQFEKFIFDFRYL
jgi:hypothetical protein